MFFLLLLNVCFGGYTVQGVPFYVCVDLIAYIKDLMMPEYVENFPFGVPCPNIVHLYKYLVIHST
jgi:hypothetical protein